MKDKDYKSLWIKLKEKKLKEYVEVHRSVNQIITPYNQYHLFEIANEMVSENELKRDLKYMDQLDGTHEFQNLLSDLERDSDERKLDLY
ncbi:MULTISPECIES: hypothetical protein [Staphylococcus]|jgi:hypothetical protein|nr:MULTISPECIES: hypothetical protein [Staphylococcus]KAB2161308.1 hypothetical protein F9B20_04100 [Staphylococcus epidermidis]KAB2237237.1 hypothetical protein F9B27_01920 [Staphylococcus epidermidis]KAB2246653.1 hypothetical protein F9B49_02100 [Staphylococcus epidermidis]KAB2249485.1 hypothetical protein F9B29_01225 [Staphylococcus epidermidis]KAB2256724.1 hypothetical protein F9B51_01225 [Staphylococcus epidermidis]